MTLNDFSRKIKAKTKTGNGLGISTFDPEITIKQFFLVFWFYAGPFILHTYVHHVLQLYAGYFNIFAFRRILNGWKWKNRQIFNEYNACFRRISMDGDTS